MSAKAECASVAPASSETGSNRHLHQEAARARLFSYILFAGICLRLAVFCFLSPFNPDSGAHLEHVRYVRDHRALPPSHSGHEAWQPPLYYLLTAGLAAIEDDPKLIQLFSLFTSIATLLVAERLIRSATFLRTDASKLSALLLVCFLPQFVMFSLYLSNDSLAILLGFLAFWQADRFFARNTTREFLLFAFVLGLGLLTKGHFIIITAILFPLSAFRYLCCPHGLWRRRAATYVLAVGILGCGSLKYIQNAARYGKPFVTSCDFKPGWLAGQQGTYQGLGSIFDINIMKLLRCPTMDSSTLHSIPLLLYGTFWYQYIPESNFHGNAVPVLRHLGRYMNAVGFLPTCLCIIGGLMFLYRSLPSACSRLSTVSRQGWLRAAAPLVFAGNLAMLLGSFFQFDAWSILQARSLFPTLLGGFVLADIALAYPATWIKTERVMTIWQWAFVPGTVAYFTGEIVLKLLWPMS